VTITAPPARPAVAPPPEIDETGGRSAKIIAIVAVAIPTFLILLVMSGVFRSVQLVDGFPFVSLDAGFPTLLLANTPTGGDTGAHVLLPQVLRDSLLPSGRILGWSSAWYTGFPVLYFYFPLPALGTLLLDGFMPYGVAFKITSILGLLALPSAGYALARSMKFSRVVAGFAGFAAGMFVFMESFSIFGANIKSTLAGEFSFSWSFALSLLYLAVVIRDTRNGRGFTPLAGVLLGLTAMSHIVTTIVVVVASIPLLARRDGPRVVLPSWILGFALSAFWALPLAFRTLQGLTTDMGWAPVEGLVGEGSSPGIVSTPLPDELMPILALGILGIAWTLIRREDVAVLLTLTVIPLLGYIFLPQLGVTKLYNARLLPYWYVGMFLFAGIAIGLVVTRLARAFPQRSQNLVIISSLALLILTNVTALGVQDVPGWVNWNFEGYEGKADYPEYRALLETVDELPDGRIMWETNADQNKYGTPMALMLLPYFSPGHDTMEGVFFESSITTPFHFLTASEVARSPSNAVRGLKYRGLDFPRGIEHMSLLGVDQYIAFTEESADAATAAGLDVIATPSPWTIFDLPDTSLVEPLAYRPVVYAGEEDFLDVSLAWFDDVEGMDHIITDEGLASWPQVTAIEDRFLSSSEYGVTGAEVTEIVMDDHQIAFTTTAIGVPHLIKVSYFPNWEVEGADGPFRATPSLMVVVPTEEQVTLTFGVTSVEKVGRLLTVVGLLVIGAWFVWRRSPRTGESETDT
jgi:hypothetical protein